MSTSGKATETHTEQVCTSCNRPRADHRMTSSGICTDCLPIQHRPTPAPGSGRAAVQHLLINYRSKKRDAQQ